MPLSPFQPLFHNAPWHHRTRFPDIIDALTPPSHPLLPCHVLTEFAYILIETISLISTFPSEVPRGTARETILEEKKITSEGIESPSWNLNSEITQPSERKAQKQSGFCGILHLHKMEVTRGGDKNSDSTLKTKKVKPTQNAVILWYIFMFTPHAIHTLAFGVWHNGTMLQSPNNQRSSDPGSDGENSRDDSSTTCSKVAIPDDDLIVQILARLDGPSYSQALYQDARVSCYSVA